MPRRVVYCIVEGQTENSFLEHLLGAHLARKGIDFHAPIVGTKGGKGGVKYLHFDHLANDIRKFLRDKRQPCVTTFFDYYAFPEGEGKGWGFAAEAKASARSHGVSHAVNQIEKEIARLALAGLGDPRSAARCFPYVQLHELEALFFAEPDKLAETLENPSLGRKFAQAVNDCGGCETINDTPQLAPSKRIEAAAPHYVKGRSAEAHAPRLATRLDLQTVRAQCPRFGAWLKRLEEIPLA